MLLGGVVAHCAPHPRFNTQHRLHQVYVHYMHKNINKHESPPLLLKGADVSAECLLSAQHMLENI